MNKDDELISSMETSSGKVRVDKYLWSIRIFKTRAQAADACSKGKVKLNGNPVKASKIVDVNEVYEIKTETRKWIIHVSGILNHRLQYSEAINFYKDITPAELLEKTGFESSAFHTGKRLSKIGRPTKKDRRELDDFLDE